jgi:predicted secreted protein
MNLTGGLVLFAVIWFLTFLIVLPIGERSQAESGHVVPGTPASAPAEAGIPRKVRITTLVTVILWSICAWVLLTGRVSMEDIDWFGRLGPDYQAAGIKPLQTGH